MDNRRPGFWGQRVISKIFTTTLVWLPHAREKCQNEVVMEPHISHEGHREYYDILSMKGWVLGIILIQIAWVNND